MNDKRKMSAVPLMILLVLMGLASVVPSIHAQTIPREEIVWACGSIGNTFKSWNPLFWSESWGGVFMYEPLFLYNMATGELEPWLGENITWVDNTTIEITLREDIYWNDGKPITAEDVVFSYDLYGRWKFAGWLPPRLEGMEAVNDRLIRVKIKPEYANSRSVWYAFTVESFNFQILPKHVWSEIIVTEPYQEWGGWRLQEFTNNWLKPDFPDRWKVASGPYLPYYVSPTLDKEILVRNENWWGIKYYGKPAPKYIGLVYHKTNAAANAEFTANKFDWSSTFLPRIWEVMEGNPYISTWYGEEAPYYLSQGGYVCLVPNHQIYPFNEPWLHRALALAIDYDDLSKTCVSGYVKKAHAAFLEPDSPVGGHLFSEEVDNTYGTYFDPEEALSILEEHCFKKDGIWYTKDVPAEYRNMSGVKDALPEVEGVNVALGNPERPWKIMVVYGWSDMMMVATMLAVYFNEHLGITCVTDQLDFGTYVSRMTGMNFQLMLFCMDGGPRNTPLSVWSSMFTGVPGQWANFAGWGYKGSKIEKLLNQYEVTPIGSPEEKELAKEIQELIAKELPIIPIYPNAYWYAYNTKYWTGWPNKDNPYIHPTAPWPVDGAAQIKMICNLKPAGAEEGEAHKQGIPWTYIAIAVVLVAIITITVLVLKHKRKTAGSSYPKP